MNKILIIIPCKNEEHFIERTLSSLLNQSLLPMKILIVDDGSTDKTKDIVEAITSKNQVVDYVYHNKASTQRSSGSAVINAFNFGLSQVDLSEYDFISKFDADLEFPPNYFESTINLMCAEKLALTGGECVVELANEWKKEVVAKNDHVRGALKTYSTKAFMKIGGLKSILGWDSLDEYELRFHGYKIKSIQGLLVKHFRPTNKTSNWKNLSKRHGVMFYQLRYGVIISLISIAKRGFVHHPKIINVFYALVGYITASFNSKPIVSKELGKFIRQYRRSQMLK